jgi:hypothetical protein
MCQENFLQDGECFPRCRLQRVALVSLSFGSTGGDVGPGLSHVRPGVHGHKARFVPDPALCDQARVGILRNDSQRVMGRP